MSIDASMEEMNKWLWLLANAQAISDGYTCHGNSSLRQHNPHQVNVMALVPFGPNFVAPASDNPAD